MALAPAVPCLALIGPGASPASSLWVENDSVHPQGTAKAIQKKYVFLSVSCRCVLRVVCKETVGCLPKLSFTRPHLDNFLAQRTVSAVCGAQSSFSLSHKCRPEERREQEADSHTPRCGVAAEAAVVRACRTRPAQHVTLSCCLFLVCKVVRCEFN